jgi:hypothetical protein
MFSNALRRTGLVARTYVSRAHPRPVTEYPVNAALQVVLEGIAERKTKRAAKWELNAPARKSKGIEVSS